MIDLKDLEAFLIILDTGSLSRAAQDLGLTQPAISLKLKKMESELGVRLFQRTPRNVIPLEAALSIEPKIRDILSQFDSVKDTLARSLTDLRGTVALGCLTGWMETLVVPFLATAAREAPGLQFKLSVADTSELIPLILRGRCDLAIVAQPFAPMEGLSSEHLFDEHLVLIGHNLPKESLPASERRRALLSRTWVTMNVPDVLVEKYWKEQFGEGAAADLTWSRMKARITCDHIHSIPSLVQKIPDAVAVVPSQIVDQTLGAHGHARETIETSETVPHRNGIYLVWRDGALDVKRLRFAHEGLKAQARAAAKALDL